MVHMGFQMSPAIDSSNSPAPAGDIEDGGKANESSWDMLSWVAGIFQLQGILNGETFV